MLLALPDTASPAVREIVSADNFIRVGKLHGEFQSLAIGCSDVDRRLAFGLATDANRTRSLANVKTLRFKLSFPIENYFFRDATVSAVVVDRRAIRCHFQRNVVSSPAAFRHLRGSLS